LAQFCGRSFVVILARLLSARDFARLLFPRDLACQILADRELLGSPHGGWVFRAASKYASENIGEKAVNVTRRQ
jgi:hypothetical protein